MASTTLALAIETQWPTLGPLAQLANAGFAAFIGKLLGIPLDGVIKSALAAMKPEKAAQLTADAVKSMPPEQAASVTVQAIASMPPEVEAAVRARFADVPLARMSGPVPVVAPAAARPRVQLVNVDALGPTHFPPSPAPSASNVTSDPDAPDHIEDTPTIPPKR